MLRKLPLLLLLCVSLPASAAAPRVVVSLGPLHSLVAGVMEGVAEPQLLLPPGTSPHAYSLKPSDARALGRAELVIWVGREMEAMLGRPLESLAGGARTLSLVEVEGMALLPAREGGVWQGHDHEAHDEHRAHEHGAVDNHLWLSPHNARRTVVAVVEALVRLDPDNAARYRDNAERVSARIDELERQLNRQLEPLRERPYIVFHDAYHYFESAFGLHPVGAITVNPEQRPGAKRLIAIRKAIRKSGAECVFSEPQFRPDIVEVVLEDTGARHGVLDPLGAELQPGRDLWFELMRKLGAELKRCLG
ncbi:MAG: zinc ABC transporter substrate-binding protein [Pseudomonadota bacterium]